MKNKSYETTMLFDFYGDLLTEKQREFFDLYYNEDFSLSEISENAGITRQGVRDVVVRAEAILKNTEEKTGIVRRFMEMQSEVAELESAAAEILSINESQYGNYRIKELALIIQETANSLKK